jgi:hypothetical protein
MGWVSPVDQLMQQHTDWTIWWGHATSGFWAMAPRGHPLQDRLIRASDAAELADLLARADTGAGIAGRDRNAQRVVQPPVGRHVASGPHNPRIF